MPTCCIRNCSNRTGNIGRGKIKYFYFPKDPQLRQKWMIACGKNEASYNPNHGRICQQHFEDECFEEKRIQTKTFTGEESYKIRLNLIPGSIPTKLLSLKKPHKEKRRERIPLYTYNKLVAALRKSNSGDPSEANSAEIDHDYIATMVPSNPQISEMRSLYEDYQKDVLAKQHTLDNLRSELCRICGHKGSELTSIFEDSDTSKDVTISSKIVTYLPIKLEMEDLLPFGICSDCLSVLNLWHDLYTTCVAADAVLWKTFGKESCKIAVSDLWTSEVQQNTDIQAEEIPSEDLVKEIPPVAHTDEVPSDFLTNETVKTSLNMDVGGGEDTFSHFVESNQTMQMKDKSFEEQFVKSCTYQRILYRCHFCSDLFNKSIDHKNHIAMCREMSTICELCGLKVSCRKDLKRHKFYKHKIVPPRYLGDKYKRCFKSVTGVGHQLENNNDTDHSGKYCCKLCGSVLRQDNCHVHNRKHENNSTKSAFLNEDFHQEMNSGSSENSVVYACPVCQERFNDMLSLAVHVT